jgi:hypothetical protein
MAARIEKVVIARRSCRLPGETGGCQERVEIAWRGCNFSERLEAVKRDHGGCQRRLHGDC